MGSTQRPVGDVLSELARDNYRGLIDPHTYRLQRAALLDDLLLDEDEEEASSTTRPQAPARDRRAGNPPLSDPANQRRRDVDRVREQVATADVLEIVDAAKEQARTAAIAAAAAAASPAAPIAAEPDREAASTAAPAPAAASGGSRWPLVAGGLVAVALVTGLVVMFSGGDAPPESRSTAVDSIVQQPGEKLIDDFVATNNWSEASVVTLTQNWQRLLPSQQREAQDASTFRNFSHDVRRRLVESAALRELDGGESDHDRALVALAMAMGFRVPLPDTGYLSEAAATDEAPVEQQAPAAAITSGAQPSVSETRQPDTAVSLPARAVAVQKDKPADPPKAVETISPPPPKAVPAPPPTVAVPAQTAEVPADNPPADTATPPVAAPANSGCYAGLLKTRQRSCTDALASGSDGPRMAIVKPGNFTMGSDWAPEEQPPHGVTLTRPFAIAAHEISHAEFSLFCKDTATTCPANPWAAGDYPVVGVSWDEATAYARWLKAQTGRNYRLPSEAEWEFAARAGVDSRYPFGDELLPVQARYASGRDADSPWPRSYRDAPRNALGVYNSIGNVREWVADAWHDSHAGAPTDGTVRNGNTNAARVVRGGSYADDAAALRLSSRARLDAGARDDRTGFRVVLDF